MKARIRRFAALSLAVALATTAAFGAPSAASKFPNSPASKLLVKASSGTMLVSALTAPNLGAAGTFAVLGASTVTAAGPSVITGNLGLSPGISVTGFPPSILVRTLHIADPTTAQAPLDLTAAYNRAPGADPAAPARGAVGPAATRGGLTLAPGLYKSTSSLEISSGDLTLDAQGDSSAVYIVEMSSTLVTTTCRKVIRAGGAQAANIYWQVGSSATLGVSSVFKGNILALASITAATGASVEGRLLARTAAVTVNANNVSVAAAVAPVADVTAPTVRSAAPFNGAIGVALNSTIVANFSEAMAAASINPTTFTLKQGATAVSGAVSFAGQTASFVPTLNLAPMTSYTATITTGARDLAGNPLATSMVWSFTTASAIVAVPPSSLGGLGTFEILAGSTVTSTGASTVTGDLGVSPGIAITGVAR